MMAGDDREALPPRKQGLDLAREQLARVQVASFEPIDWSDLAMYAMYALENAVIAAADHLGIPWRRTHVSKVETAQALHRDHGLSDVSSLLQDLNELRKSEAYGEIHPPISLDAEDVATEVELFVEAVGVLLAQGR